MDCNNCGAPMKLLDDRDYFVCEYCGTYGIPNEGRDGVRILSESSQVGCPLCRICLVTASIDGNRVLHCPNCRGILFDQKIFAFAISYLSAGLIQPEPPPGRFNRAELGRALFCPQCNLYGGARNLVVDNCYACRLIWLDYGELDRIITALGNDRKKDRLDF
jgi:Zn-finger nucleic acid-binding protein